MPQRHPRPRPSPPPPPPPSCCSWWIRLRTFRAAAAVLVGVGCCCAAGVAVAVLRLRWGGAGAGAGAGFVGVAGGATTTTRKREPGVVRSPASPAAAAAAAAAPAAAAAAAAAAAIATTPPSSGFANETAEGRKRRRRRRSPHRVYCCGWPTCLADQIFPDAEVLPPVHLQDDTTIAALLPGGLLTTTFRDDDVLLHSCGGPCPIPQDRMDEWFPGPILTLNGESDPSTCRIGDNKKRKKRSGIVSLDRIGGGHASDDDEEKTHDNDTTTNEWNEASTYYAGLVLASQPKEWRNEFLERIRPRGGGGNNSSTSRGPAPGAPGERFLIYAHSNCVPYRERAYRSLSRLGDVHYGGACRGRWTRRGWWGWWGSLPRPAVGQPATDVRSSAAGWAGNRQLFCKYRFVLCMENMNTPGYISEKILVAFLAPSVPIYYGTPEVFDVFNRNAFVYYDIDHPQEALDRVAYLEGNRTAYLEVLREPILANGQDTFDKYFSLWDDDDKNTSRTNKVGDTARGAGGRLKWAIRERIGFGRGSD